MSITNWADAIPSTDWAVEGDSWNNSPTPVLTPQHGARGRGRGRGRSLTRGQGSPFELEVQRLAFKEHSKVLDEANKQTDTVKKVELLTKAIKSWTGSGSVHDTKIIEGKLHLNDLEYWIQQAKKDPSFSDDIAQSWADVLEQHIKHTATRFNAARLFGKLFNEWLKSGDSSTVAYQGPSEEPGEASEAATHNDAPSSVEVGRKEMYNQKAKLQSIVFEDHLIDTERLKSYLKKLFELEESTKALENLRRELKEFSYHFKRRKIATKDVQDSLTSLLASGLMDEEKRVTLKAIQDNATVLEEVASVLNMRIASIQSWSWPNDGVLVEFRRHLNGKYRAFTDPEIVDGLLLHYIGIHWQAKLKRGRVLDHPQARTDNAGQSNLEAIMLQESTSRTTRYDDLVDAPEPSDDDPSSPAQIKRALLHIITTESYLNQAIKGSHTILRSDFEWFGPSLPHKSILTILEFMGMSKTWLGFYDAFLTAPIYFPGESPRVRLCGTPISYSLSVVCGEAVLFMMDYAVNQRSNGLHLYRMHDDLWLWDSNPSKVATGWEEMNIYTELVGLKFNQGKTGSAYVGPKTKEVERLPKGDIRRGFLQFNVDKARFIIAQTDVDSHIVEMRRQLASTKSVFGWVNAYNKYMMFFLRNFGGLPANCVGNDHLMDMMDTLGRIQRQLFAETEVGGAVGYLRKIIKERFDTTGLPEGYFYLPTASGGLELHNTMLDLLSLTKRDKPLSLPHTDLSFEKKAKKEENIASNFSYAAEDDSDLEPEDELDVDENMFSEEKVVAEHKFSERIKHDKAEYNTLKEVWEQNRDNGRSKNGHYLVENKPSFMPFDEFISLREQWHSGWGNSYRNMQLTPPPVSVQLVPKVRELMEHGSVTWDELDWYQKWVVSMYGEEVVKRFGRLEAVDPNLIPIGMLELFKSSRMKLDHTNAFCARKTLCRMVLRTCSADPNPDVRNRIEYVLNAQKKLQASISVIRSLNEFLRALEEEVLVGTLIPTEALKIVLVDGEESMASAGRAKKQTDTVKKVELLTKAIKSWTGSGSVHDTKIIGGKLHLSDLEYWLQQAKKDPSFSEEIAQSWADAVEQHIKHTGMRFDAARLFGKLFNEWLESGDSSALAYQAPSKEPGGESDAATETGGSSFVEGDRKEMYEKKAKLQSIVFEDYPIETEKLKTYLEKLFERRKITKDDVINTLKGLLASNLIDQEKRSTLKAFDNNATVLKEVASVLNMRMANIQSWSWPKDGILVEFRRHLNGKYRAFTDPEIIDALFLHYVGVHWQVQLKSTLGSFFSYSKAWTRPEEPTTHKDCKRWAAQVGRHDEMSPSINQIRMQERSATYFMSQFHKSPRHVMAYDAVADALEGSDDNLPTRTEVKRKLLHILTTESYLVKGSHTTLRSDLEWFGPSLPHQSILTVLEFLVPIYFPGESPRVRLRGTPINYSLSVVCGEVVFFIMDYAVNQRSNGLHLYRMHDDLWLMDSDPVKVVAGWEEMNKYATLVGLKFNQEKTGSAYVGPTTSVAERLPKGDIRWGFLRFDVNKARFLIDQKDVNGHIEEMRRQLASTKSVFGWVNAYSKYMMSFFGIFGGVPANCFGIDHLNDMIDTLGRIQQELFGTSEVGGPVGYLRWTIKERFDTTDLPEDDVDNTEPDDDLGTEEGTFDEDQAIAENKFPERISPIKGSTRHSRKLGNEMRTNDALNWVATWPRTSLRSCRLTSSSPFSVELTPKVEELMGHGSVEWDGLGWYQKWVLATALQSLPPQSKDLNTITSKERKYSRYNELRGKCAAASFEVFSDAANLDRSMQIFDNYLPPNMKFAFLLTAATFASTATAHYVFGELVVGDSTGEILYHNAVRQPRSYYPLWLFNDDISSNRIRCNDVTQNATETVTVKPGQIVGLAINASESVLPSIYHTGPAALYLSKAPGLAQDYVGDGDWIKFSIWGPEYDPFRFNSDNLTALTSLLPNIPSGEYLLRAEHSAIHDINSPQFYIGCAQIKVENPGTPVDLPAGFKMPGYVTGKEPSFVFNVTAENITYYPMPDPPYSQLPVVIYP
ncbi:hypothetical protein CPB83DRAFT_837589 [Crepidotus variabilis]|uniref:AA9 family lytic polysaccharide monooxygenase n=1 Tax=Crepidotus variabilis TaxID=179855 RepID=A0A9P6JME5_9AGAR|nr:hypothetical protein CPB83DRAFT_837589 [Crepidotus variabilis]